LTFTLDAAASPYPPSPAPSTPQNPTATAGVGRVWLKWTPSVTANGYTVLRSTNRGGPYTIIASYAGTFPVCEDVNVTNGTTYYYVVAARNQAGASGNSLEVSAMPMSAGDLPAGWALADIGKCDQPGTAGYAAVSNSTLVFGGSGDGIGNKADGLCYVYEKVSGDVTFTVRRAEATFDGGGEQKIGIMIRESLEPGAKALAMVSGDVGAREARFGERSADGAAMRWQNGNAYTAPSGPTWFRLRRSGDNFIAYQSIDGVTWFAVGSSVVVPMNRAYYVGLTISSNGAKRDTAQFDNATVGSDLSSIDH